MAELGDFHANGVELDAAPRPDVDRLVQDIPADGTLHIAILQQPYLDLIVDGTKTVESRFNTKRAAPYGKVAVGDLVLLKETGKPITSYFFAADVQNIDLQFHPITSVREEYSDAICPEDPETFWRQKTASRFCTLVAIGERGLLLPLPIFKQDQRGWVTFARTPPEVPTLF